MRKNETVCIFVEPPKAEEASTDKCRWKMMLKLQKSVRKAPTMKIVSLKTWQLPMLMLMMNFGQTGELHCPEIDGKIAFICFQCGMEYIPKNYKKGDEIEKHILCKMCKM